ncbi:hypothetical protein B0H13DRAFT_2289941 [Mycena leptocephala]|nr:hypothetical protein B0H13DRAFT_2289941 [Mycena leptocephala]
MGAYDDPFGSILIGSWLASILFGLVLNQTFQYFKMYPKDPLSRKGIVVCSLAFCSAALVADYANVYLPTITFWGNTERVQKQYWPVPMYVTMNTCVGVIVNGFLIHRFYSISKNIVVCIVLWVFVMMGFVGSVLVAITIQVFSAFSARDKAEMSALVWLISTATADIAIAGALIWKLRSMKTGFKGTQSLIRRLTIQAVQTGATTSVVSIVTLVSYMVKNESNVPTACCYLIGPLYLLTLFYNLNRRQHDIGPSGSGRATSDGNSGMRMDGIHVHRTALVTVEADPNVAHVQHTGYNPHSSLKDPDTESYSGKKAPEF